MTTRSLVRLTTLPGRRLPVAALLAALAFTLVLPAPASAQARAHYERALAQAQALRLDGPRPSPLSQMRRAIDACEAVAARHPASGYADNALWEAAGVALAAHRVYGSPVDRESGERLLARLVRGYPSSSLRPRAVALLRTAKSAPKPAPPPARQAAKPADASLVPASTRAEAVPAPPAIPPGAGPPLPATLRKVTRERFADFVRVVIELDAEASFRREELAGPARLYFDFDATRAVPELVDAVLRFDGPAARQIRLGRPRADVTRLVIDLEGSDAYSVFTLYHPYRVTVDLRHRPAMPQALVARAVAPRLTKPMAPPSPRAVAATFSIPERLQPRPLPHPLADRPVASLTPVPGRRVAPILAPPPLAARAMLPGYQVRLIRAPRSGPTAWQIELRLAQDLARARPPLAARSAAPTAPALPPPAPPAQNGEGRYSLARQLGLGVSRIVIDPGHGGHDPGVPGARKTTEAEVVLDVALRLEKLLAREAGVEVVMTRRTDVYVALEQRTAIANRAGADLFLSIHANSSRNKDASGVETYFLNLANNPEAEAVAARENATAAHSMHQLPDMVRTIALNNKLDESRDFAERVQTTLVSRLGVHNDQLRDRGVKQAPFVVLIGAGMPSVLAEIAFLSHQGESGLLRTERYRQRVAEALCEAVLTYQRSLKAVGTVASH
jgi:N-acetylmuramoyl-L-alanine amidase